MTSGYVVTFGYVALNKKRLFGRKEEGGIRYRGLYLSSDDEDGIVRIEESSQDEEDSENADLPQPTAIARNAVMLLPALLHDTYITAVHYK